MALVLIIPEGFDVVAGASAPVGMSECGLRRPFKKRGVSVEPGPLQVQPWWGGSRLRCVEMDNSAGRGCGRSHSVEGR